MMKYLKQWKSKRFQSFFIPFLLMIGCITLYSWWNHKNGFEINMNAIAVCFVAALGQGAKYIHDETQRPSGYSKTGEPLKETQVEL